MIELSNYLEKAIESNYSETVQKSNPVKRPVQILSNYRLIRCPGKPTLSCSETIRSQGAA
jgi:hypothetical protein